MVQARYSDSQLRALEEARFCQKTDAINRRINVIYFWGLEHTQLEATRLAKVSPNTLRKSAAAFGIRPTRRGDQGRLRRASAWEFGASCGSDRAVDRGATTADPSANIHAQLGDGTASPVANTWESRPHAPGGF